MADTNSIAAGSAQGLTRVHQNWATQDLREREDVEAIIEDPEWGIGGLYHHLIPLSKRLWGDRRKGVKTSKYARATRIHINMHD